MLLGLFMLVKAVSYWLDRYGLAMSDGSLFTGISYTDANAVLPAKNILMIIALICAAALLRQRLPAGLDAAGARASACSILSAILIGGIWPAIVQRFQVKPSEPDKEAPLHRARTSRRPAMAYDIDDVDPTHYPGVTTDTARADAAARLTSCRASG